jgi:CHASE3 domain sensor protein
MTTNLLETDQALEALLKELQTLKSSSEQLQSASQVTAQVVQAAEQVTTLSTQMVDNSTKQLAVIADSSVTTGMQLQAMVATQKAFIGAIQDFLHSELRPTLERYQQTAATNRWLLIATLLLALLNLALIAWQVFEMPR